MKIFVVTTAIWLFIMFFIFGWFKIEYGERDKYYSYCGNKGFSYDACKYEYERIKNGSQTVIFPMVDNRKRKH